MVNGSRGRSALGTDRPPGGGPQLFIFGVVLRCLLWQRLHVQLFTLRSFLFKSLMGFVAQQTSLPLHLESRAPCTYIYFPTCSAVPTFIHIYCRCVYGQESGNTVCIVIQGRQYDVLRHVAIYWHNNILCFF